MVFRCRQCQRTVWIQTDQQRSTTVSCPGCQQDYELAAWTSLRHAEVSIAERARKLALGSNIDLPGAYSVVLGIMTLSDVERLGSRRGTECRVTPGEFDDDPASGTEERAERYDPAFAKAVEAGHLCPRQAVERGRRDAYASLIAARHDLPMVAAYAVADNRVSVLEAVRRQGRARSVGTVSVRVHTGRGRRVAWTALAIVLLGWVLAATAWRVFATSAGEPPVFVGTGGESVRMDGRGRVLQIFGDDPQGVLSTFCDAQRAGGRYEALKVVPSARHGNHARLGLLRRPEDPATLLAITILEDREAGRWVAGDGRRPLIAEPAPEQAIQAIRLR